MATEIQWTDETWNPVTGCTKVSPGCAHCYAEELANRFWKLQYPITPKAEGPRKFTDVWTHADRLDQPLRWKKPARVFVNSMSDLFHEAVPDQFLHDVYHVMEQARQHTFQILTKRAARMHDYLNWRYGPDAETPRGRIPSRHIWHGVSVENQPMYDERIGKLLRTPSAIRFLSVEPMLGSVDLRMGGMSLPDYSPHDPLPQVDWVIVGGESGPQSRPCPVWSIRHLVRQCRKAGVSVFVKQLGAHVITRNDDGFEGDSPCSWPMDTRYDEVLGHPGWQGDPVRIRLLDRKGGDMSEWPEDLRVREFPHRRRACGGTRLVSRCSAGRAGPLRDRTLQIRSRS